MFERFLSILVVVVQHVVSCLVALAIGGLDGHWLLAVVFVTLAIVAALVGVSVRRIGWRLGGVIFAAEFLAWLAPA